MNGGKSFSVFHNILKIGVNTRKTMILLCTGCGKQCLNNVDKFGLMTDRIFVPYITLFSFFP